MVIFPFCQVCTHVNLVLVRFLFLFPLLCACHILASAKKTAGARLKTVEEALLGSAAKRSLRWMGSGNGCKSQGPSSDGGQTIENIKSRG